MNKSGTQLIEEERQRQISQEGWTPEHDDTLTYDELALAAACYAMPTEYRGLIVDGCSPWPWSTNWWKPTPDDRIRELVKAGALIAAEIDRIQRAREPKLTALESTLERSKTSEGAK